MKLVQKQQSPWVLRLATTRLWDAFLGNRFDKEISPNIPVTIIFGDSDNTLPANNSQEKSLAPKHSKWVVLSQSGHAPMWDQVDAVVAETIETINRRVNV